MSGFRPKRWSSRPTSGRRSVPALTPSTPVEPPAEELVTDYPATEPAAEINATDSARSLAAQHKLDLADVTGTGIDGRITRDDVNAHLEQTTPR